ncbi:MAG: threonine--tRNA ligase [Candidatus Colwellbacteria bacterium RIFCSPHIGHO2_02_FULL_43_15]|uniref:Threonine--tRNA ligase n=2 Tax=Candidatus Colwelliibacteriota TaxID=1817904 RepID=A0A1G1Z078_9BACT|nr:MAG: threonine--tRNA ligase [Candidatus Colwellbacteria bacterium RIFCSPHIGHO2_02_FULL_43_15]OGY61299.1 MAG: threonine--tRNA ligase [Candidatus Colwellbacteria bacterium RIFCSPLOWO2_12_FULL_43_11]
MQRSQKISPLEGIRHSLAHLLAAAVIKKFPKAKLGIGPTIENGFYYDFLLPKSLTPDDLKELETTMKSLAKAKLEFSGKKVTPGEAKKIFKDQPFKLDLIKEFVKEKKSLTVYKTYDKKTGEVYFLDLCRGGHVKNTSEINADSFKLNKIAGAYWRGDEKNEQLQRIYGLAFETEKELKDYAEMLAKAETSDHRNLADKLQLFMVDENIGRGLPLWLPNAYTTRKVLEDYMYELERRAGYKHVLTPHLAKEDLYKTSGHLAHYKDDMYAPIEIEGVKYYLKPMNCPHHHSIYKYSKRSYRELPLRIAEFGTVYRYERSGTLTGLIRVRAFTQNDAHIYTDEERLESEIVGVLNLHKKVYEDMGISDYWYRLSLPDFKNKEKFGDVKNKAMWDKGSAVLKKALKETGHKFVEAPGEATFYGPKIDIQIKDIYGKEDSIATVQVDYYSAAKFNLTYIDKENKEKPVIIVHRAILGSFDRFFAFLIEKTSGNLPLWLAPVQVKILAVSDKHADYAEELNRKLINSGIRSEVSPSNETLGKRIREAEMQRIPYIAVVGDEEIKKGTLSLRIRGQGSGGEHTIADFIENIKQETNKFLP